MYRTRISDVAHSILKLAGDNNRLAQPATREQLLSNHAASYIDKLYSRAPAEPGQFYKFDDETVMNYHTLRALELSVGGACQAVDMAIAGEAPRVFVAGYAGHHARYDRALGFCFLNSVAIAAKHAVSRGLSRVAVLDIDTHSGCGTVLGLMNHPAIVFAETYQQGFPGSFMPGYAPENVRRRLVKSPYEYNSAWADIIDYVDAYGPELVIVSAGFDAHLDDELSKIGVLDRDYVALADAIRSTSRRIVACLEGGYSPSALPRCAALFYEHLTR
jgi:acetoin utilization deacetylase AcuC-like enzyme